ncbi:anhydro-N-acetylmuramic acid kinase [Solimonas sp. K1W22B-7]|uniref:anhydro-N-acetylmuramic acid kinase n=1 Tax=Solimonas sp. K1W22B-7 TaxID=2303331 RepID=UPI000E32F242|nr:anhydro-N-acetylmuramic acid kinase [Solimonas sp. K1W22B-7]AXQ27442.1 anhydro-N-acetylmuramic acid kinase [Solimonas sp. K1W22B-7]
MTEYFIGLMSGTSMDGIDAAVCAFDDSRFLCVHAHASGRYPAALRARLLALQRETPTLSLHELARLDRDVAQAFADTAQAALEAARLPREAIRAVGSHGQTVFHDPAGTGSSQQLGNPSWIAQQLGITTVADFRRADIAAGGQGAPLVPAFHHALFAEATLPRAVVNLGGIANITLLPGAGEAQVSGFDTGPANGLMDEWAERHLGQAYDEGGHFAGGGQLHAGLLEVLLGDPYFAAAPPKSTGRGDFHLQWLHQRYPALDALAPADVQRTLCELTARTVAEAIRRHGPGTREVLACGGGTRNHLLMERLHALLSPIRLHTTGDAGLDPQHVEAAAFAWLAMRTLKGLPGNLPAVTGAKRPVILGGVYRV